MCCLMFDDCCSGSCVVCRVLPIDCCSLLVVCCPLFCSRAVWMLRCVACCLLFDVCCLLFVV